MLHAQTRILDGVRHIAYGNPSAVCYIGSVMALMEYLGDPVDIDDLFVLSGVALCFPWEYRSCCDEVSIISQIPQRTFRALGYQSEYLYEPDPTGAQRTYSKQLYKAKIRDSIDRGHPVLGFGFTHGDPFSCVIAGYEGGAERLFLRAYWTPEGTPTGHASQDAYCAIDDWYEKCYGIVVVGDKTDSHLSGTAALDHIRQTAAIFEAKRTILIQGRPIAVGFGAYDRMLAWLLDDDAWRCVEDHHGVFLSPCGLLLLGHYRNALYRYLSKAFGDSPDANRARLLRALLCLRDSIGGEDSQLHLDEKVSPEITGLEKLTDHRLREQVAALVGRLKSYDEEIFGCLERL